MNSIKKISINSRQHVLIHDINGDILEYSVLLSHINEFSSNARKVFIDDKIVINLEKKCKSSDCCGPFPCGQAYENRLKHKEDRNNANRK